VVRRPIFFLSLVLILLTTGACSSLPDILGYIDDFPNSAGYLTVVGSKGRMGPEESEAAVALQGPRGDPRSGLSRNLAVMESLGGSPVFAGNRVTLLNDGDATFQAMLTAIGSAKDHVNMETYIIDDDDVGRRFADLLIEKRAHGVTVNLIYDRLGSRRTPRSFFDRLKKGGVNIVEFNPLNPLRLPAHEVLYHRTHRKMLIVDGKSAFVGGVNIGSAYLRRRIPGEGGAAPSQLWRDTHLMVEGPAVTAFQELFFRTWTKQNAPLPGTGHYFPEVHETGDQMVQVVASTRGPESRICYMMYVSAIVHARRSVHLTQSYFAPDEQMMRALKDAARRGVDVKIVLPEYSDHGIVRHAGRWHYGELLDAGVKLYERSGVVLHAKTAVIDDSWSTICSTNLDLWSLVTNDEVNAVVIGPAFAEEMEASFQRDLLESKELLAGEWQHRPLPERARQFFAHLFEYWL
jgi:cardiolipin synthase